ncbi:MAG TPA: response regulator transcription factor [Balneolales bacterium]|nr:response regulator transcription factor [Balneolales bacterium]
MVKKISVCVVEDIQDIRLGVERIINASDDFLCPKTFGDAEEALSDLPQIQPDIVLMDINLPGISGIECIRRVKSKCPDIQFMMFTIYEDSEQVFDAISAGANGYLLKKASHGQILAALRELYDGGAPMSTHIARKVVSAFQKVPANNEVNDNPLTVREKEVLQLLSKGYLYKEISDQLNISTGTVRQHIHKIYEKLHVQNRTEAINKYYGKPRIQ